MDFMGEELYITITGQENNFGNKPFGIGTKVLCIKEPENDFDSEAIVCIMPFIGKVGYIANSTKTVALGTFSAGRIYDKVPDKFFVQVKFVTKTKVICLVLDEEPGIDETNLAN